MMRATAIRENCRVWAPHPYGRPMVDGRYIGNIGGRKRIYVTNTCVVSTLRVVLVMFRSVLVQIMNHRYMSSSLRLSRHKQSLHRAIDCYLFFM